LEDIVISEELTKISIDNLELKGKITIEEEQRILKLFPKTNVMINGKLK
jgi:hypothetical protein